MTPPSEELATRPPIDEATNRGGRPADLNSIETPSVVIDLDRLRANIEMAAGIARKGGVDLRPHIKSHKSLRIAELQIAAGATGITAAKTSEAIEFLKGGVESVTIAYPLVDPIKINRVSRFARERGKSVSFVIDGQEGLSALVDVARNLGVKLSAYVKVDVGLHRCGVPADGPAALSLIRLMTKAEKHLSFEGLLSHAGHAYAAQSTEAVRSIAAEERTAMTRLGRMISEAGIPVPKLSVGATPTFIENEGFAGLTEARPGNYVFMDLVQVSLGVARREQIALSVVATVVSRNDQYAIIDAGSKVLSSDSAPHGGDRLAGFGEAYPVDGSADVPLSVARLSEEHGFVVDPGRRLKVGQRVRVLPNHACPVANLALNYAVIRGSETIEYWPVDARAAVQ
jgi:D-serine deaminase-like pyridoxal phosphate-dependent protein